MDTIPYLGPPTAAQSPMGLILPLALAAAVLLLTTVWKPAGRSAAGTGKRGLQIVLLVAAGCWTAVWVSLSAQHTHDANEAALRTVLNLKAGYGLEISRDDALAVVTDDLDGHRFEGETEAGVILLEAKWAEDGLHLYSTGYEAAVVDRASSEH